MTERIYRLILGMTILLFLFMEWTYAIYAYLAILIFEAITNWRIPILISRARYTPEGIRVTDSENQQNTINYEAERMLRWIMVLFIALGTIFFPDELWFIPWLIGLNLLLTGMTGICPMVMLLRHFGLR